MVIQYKCKNCGADMVYDSQTGTLHCNSCGREDSIEAMPFSDVPEGEEDEMPSVEPFSTEHIEEEASFSDDEPEFIHTVFGEDARQYFCRNCGAVIVTDADTTATTCSFCGAPVVLGDRLSGELAPAKVIPFSISKQQAQEAFVKWAKKGRLCPKDFMTADRIKNITGMYVPFWLYDLHAKGDADAVCTRSRSYSRGDYIYTETTYYHVYRKADLHYRLVPADASAKLDDGMMDKLEPFHYNELKDFNMPYLAGFLAEKYNYDDKELFPRIRERVGSYADSYLRNSIQGYSSVHYNRKDIHVYPKNAYYTLLPVWLVCYDYKDAAHTFLMNGQTGKIVGKPPLSSSRILCWLLAISGASFALLTLLFFLLTMGGVLA